MEKKASENNSTMLAKLIGILDCFTLYDPILSSKEIGEKIGIHNSSLFRYISNLCEYDLLEKDPATGKYMLGMRAVQMGGIRLSCIDALRVGFTDMDQLCKEAHCNVNMAVLYKGDSLHIHYVLGNESPSRTHTVIGRRTPAHMTALGKAIYAYMPRKKVHEIIETYGWRSKLTINSLDSFKRLDADLDAIVERGYAIDNMESSMETYCIAAPIFHQNREAVAAISLSSKTDLIIKMENQMRKSLISHAKNISYKLGYFE